MKAIYSLAVIGIGAWALAVTSVSFQTLHITIEQLVRLFN